jgi:hypothetical protein
LLLLIGLTYLIHPSIDPYMFLNCMQPRDPIRGMSKRGSRRPGSCKTSLVLICFLGSALLVLQQQLILAQLVEDVAKVSFFHDLIDGRAWSSFAKKVYRGANTRLRYVP